MIIPIYKQPVRMAPFDERDYACEGGKQFCSLYKNGDTIRVQLKQTPCGDNLVCNPEFGFGAELVTNGSFTGSATGWTLGSGWSYSSNTVVHTGGASAITQALAGVSVGQMYQVTIKIGGFSGVDINVSIASGLNYDLTTDGTFTFPLVAGGTGSNLTIGSSSAFDVTIDDVSVKKIDCWVFNQEDTTIASGVACHTPGSASDLSNDIYGSLTANDYVQITYAVFGMSAGSVEVKVGGTTVRTVTQNGSFIDYVITTLSDTLLLFAMDADFNGCIQVISSYKLLKADEITSALLDVDGNQVVGGLTTELNKDRINISTTTDFLDDGCYYISVLDPCATLENGTEINSDTGFDSPGDWTLVVQNGVDGIQVTGGVLECTNVNTAGGPYYFQAEQSHIFPDGTTTCAVEITVEVGLCDSTPNIGELQFLYPNNGGLNYNLLEIEQNAVGSTTYTISGIITISNGTSGTYHNKWALRYVATGLDTEVNRFDFLSIKITEAVNADNVLTSNCLQVLTDVGNSLIVRGESNESNSLGFIFDTNFPYIETRLFTHFINPRTPNEQNNYLYSNSYKKKTRAGIEKIYDLQFEEVDENMHDVIAAILASDHCYMGVTTSLFREYIWEEKSYEPLWPKKSPTGVAESQVEIARINSTEFN